MEPFESYAVRGGDAGDDACYASVVQGVARGLAALFPPVGVPRAGPDTHRDDASASRGLPAPTVDEEA